MSNRREKLIALQQYLNLETGEVDTSAFEDEKLLYEKSILKKSLDSRICRCDRCPGLNIKRSTECCCGYGDLNARIFFIGQSLHQPGVDTGVPFINPPDNPNSSGWCIDAALRLSGLRRKDVFMSNVLHCHPPNNRQSTAEEKENCLEYLQEELDIVCPDLVILLGNDAAQAPLNFNAVGKVIKMKHPATFSYSAPERKIDWILKLSKILDKVT
jgi:uracil-DNA glycosylase family 4